MRELDGGKEFVISAVADLGEGIRGLYPHLAAPKMIIFKSAPYPSTYLNSTRKDIPAVDMTGWRP